MRVGGSFSESPLVYVQFACGLGMPVILVTGAGHSDEWIILEPRA